jgi:predicted unusual protein kinase regulating ubiquinone biosynthesis (AarF/ABC1/UbiB family)
VHRAITHDGRAVAVKVQYPGIAETIEADLGNVGLLRRMLKITAPSQDVDALLEELRERITEELDYRAKPATSSCSPATTRATPRSHVPGSSRSCPPAGWSPATSRTARGSPSWPAGRRPRRTWPRRRSTGSCSGACTSCTPSTATRIRATTCSSGGGRVTFLDFGLVKHFTADELRPLVAMVKHLCVENDPEAFRRAMEDAGFLMPDAPMPTDMIVEHMALFYDTVRERGPKTMTGEYASAVTRRFFDFRSPLAAYAARSRGPT